MWLFKNTQKQAFPLPLLCNMELVFVKNGRIYRFKELILRQFIAYVLRKLKGRAVPLAIQKSFLQSVITYTQPRPSACSLLPVSEIKKGSLSKTEFIVALPKLFFLL